MKIFDEYIKSVSGYIDGMRKNGRHYEEFTCEKNGFPFKTGAGAGSGLVLKSDTFLELGSPSAGSCSFVMGTSTPSMIKDGRIRMIGKDIEESSEAYPFGQIVMAGGGKVGEDTCLRLGKAVYTGDLIEGYMVKSSPGNIWTRISRETASKGFNFRLLGSALSEIIKAEIPEITSVEIVFITSSKADLESLSFISRKVGKTLQGLKEKSWKNRGINIYDCAFHGNCASCKDKSVCDKIGEIAVNRSAGRKTL